MVRTSGGVAVALTLAAAIGLGCMGGASLRTLGVYRYFEAPAPDDPWTPKIAAWQSRELSLDDAERRLVLASVSGGGSDDEPARSEDLRAKYLAYRAERKRATARELARWIQEQAPHHYRPDGAVDHWATLQETLNSNGDDCDGLELLVYHFLRTLGFGAEEIYRAIVYRPDDGQHHMVTLWFENREDPWVIDPTGAMTSGMPRMSQVDGWVPLKIFSDTQEYSVGRRATGPAAHAASLPRPADR